VLKLAVILEALTGKRFPEASLIISEAAIDSRQVIPAAMFVALPGERVDGHDYVENAFQRGAHLALVDKDLSAQFSMLDLREGHAADSLVIPQPPFCIRVDNSLAALQTIAKFWRSQFANLRVIGITGSVGKSTTKELIAEVLHQHYRTLKNIGNLNNEIGLPLSLLRLNKGHQCAVLEMGFYVAGEIALLCDLAQPQVGVITNIGTVHAERAGTKEAIAEGKSELVQALPPSPQGVAILNYDDPLVRQMASKTSASIFYYGLEPEADLWADQIEGLGLEGIRFRLHHQNETIHLRVPLIGRHSVQTVLRAAAVGLVEDLTWDEIVTGLQHGRNQLRMVAVNTENGALVLDDTYNASPESTLAALNLLEEMNGRKIAVLGDMLELGPYEVTGHRMVGVRAAQVCDLLVGVGQRSQNTIQAALDSGMQPSRTYWTPDTQGATELLLKILHEGDVVLIKGSRGLQMEKIVYAIEASE